MTTNAPVGPPICTREPPRAEMRNPAMMAVNSPRSGLTPLAIAKAMASGSATIPTMMPALRSARNCSRVYPPRNVVTSFGTSLSRFPGREATQRIERGRCCLPGEAEQVVQRVPARAHRGHRERGDDEHQVVLVASVLDEEPLRPVDFGDRHDHRGHDQQARQGGQQPEQEQESCGELAAYRQRGPDTGRAEPQAADEAGGPGEARTAVRPERLLRAVAQEDGPEDQPQRQHSKIEHCTPPQNVSKSRYLISNNIGTMFPACGFQ